MDDLSAILDYEMTPDEAQAYKIAVLWQEMAPLAFPNYTRHAKLPKRGDPRKCLLFKVGWKLHAKYKGVLQPEEYKLYIKAQLDLLKELNKTNEELYLDPQCLVSEAAWVRWKVWKKHYDDAIKLRVGQQLKVTLAPDKLRTELLRTRAFFTAKFGTHSEEALAGAVGDIARWAATTKVSPFYLVLSPWVRKLGDRVGVDLSGHAHQLGADAGDVFRSVFPEEEQLVVVVDRLHA